MMKTLAAMVCCFTLLALAGCTTSPPVKPPSASPRSSPEPRKAVVEPTERQWAETGRRCAAELARRATVRGGGRSASGGSLPPVEIVAGDSRLCGQRLRSAAISGGQVDRVARAAQRTILRRITGAEKEIFDARFLRSLKTPLYVLADRQLGPLPAGPPRFEEVVDADEIVLRACAAGHTAYFVELSTVWAGKLDDGRLAVELAYKASAVSWRHARWRHLPTARRSSINRPRASLDLYGAWASFVAVHSAGKVRLYQCSMIVS